MRNIPNILGQYREGDSFVHRLDPRTKIGSMLILSGVIFSLTATREYAVFAGVLLLVLKLCQVTMRQFLASLRPASWLILLLFALHLNGSGGWQVGLRLSLRFIYILSLALVVTSTTPIFSLQMGLRKLLKPLDIFHQLGESISFMMTMALRFIPLTLAENQKLSEAQKIRGIEYSLKNAPLLIYTLLVNVMKRSEHLAQAIDARGWRLHRRRTSLYELRFSRNDALAMALVIFFSVGILRII